MSKTRIVVAVDPLSLAQLDDLRLAYQAGVLDGEGCIHIARQKYPAPRRRACYRLRLTIAQNHLRTLADFQRDVGVEGRIYETRRTNVQNRDAYALTYDGAAAAEVIVRLRPFLRRKRPEATMALEYQAQCEVSTRFGGKGAPADIWHLREWYYNKLRAMK